MNQNLHRTGKRIAAVATVLAMTVGTIPAFAAAPTATVDEAMYINADHYGTLKDITVVKAVNFNGIKEYTDHGDYLRVDNMSNREKPVIDGNAVTWTLPEDNRRFYFSGQLQQTELPWTFDVSYFHNGQPADPAKLAGASGLIEIEVKATPNEKASDYYRKNMLMQVVVMVDMEKTYSLRAEGAQMQSAGTSAVALFMGLPGEEEDFRIQVGSDSFESPGVLITMIPATASQLSQIKDLKETMDKAEEAGDALHAGINSMLSAISGMKPGLNQVKSGVSDLNEARKIADNSVDGVLDRMDTTIGDLQEMAASVRDMDDELKQSATDMNNLSAQLRHTKRQLDDVTEEMDDLGKDAEALIEEYMTDYVTEQVEKNRTLVKEIKEDATARVTEQVTEMAKKKAVEAAGGLEAFGQLTPEEQMALVGRCAAEIQADGDTMDQLTEKATEAAKKSILTEDRLKKEIPYYANVRKLQRSLKSTSSELSDMSDELQDLLGDTGTALQGMADILQEMRPVLDKTAKLLESSGDLMGELQKVVKDCRPYVQSGGKNSMEGMISTLDETMNVLDSTQSVRNANNTLKRLIDDEMDSLREENQLLEIDPDAPMQSCTSAENVTPNTLQIIVRTEEISLDSQQEAIVDLEEEARPTTPFQRMVAIFEKIIAVIREVFETEA